MSWTFEAVGHLLNHPIPVWVLIGLFVILWYRDGETRRWIMRIALAVDKMDSDESGWCRHDPVAFVTADPSEAARRLLEILQKRDTPKKN